MTKDEALRLALEAFEGFYDYGYDRRECFEHITAIKEALAQPEQEPVAYMWPTKDSFVSAEDVGLIPNWTDYYTIPLYTTPPQPKELEATERQVEMLSDDLSKCSKALRLALEALEEYCKHGAIFMPITAITAIKEALAQPEPPPECQTEAEKTAFAFGWFKAMEAQRAQPEQEPVANYCKECLTYNGHHEGCSHYTAPPKRTWVGLTSDERIDIIVKHNGNRFQVAHDIEAKLKEKNT